MVELNGQSGISGRTFQTDPAAYTRRLFMLIRQSLGLMGGDRHAALICLADPDCVDHLVAFVQNGSSARFSFEGNFGSVVTVRHTAAESIVFDGIQIHRHDVVEAELPRGTMAVVCIGATPMGYTDFVAGKLFNCFGGM